MHKSLYVRPNKPDTMVVKKREWKASETPSLEVAEVVMVDKSTECHVTPLQIARTMAGYLGGIEGFKTLEPQAGTGNLLKAVLDSGCLPEDLVAVERSVELSRALSERFKGSHGVQLVNECFLDYAKKQVGKQSFERIIMNPPFRGAYKHMKAAISLLGSKAGKACRLVALVPITYENEDAEVLEILDRDVFSTVKVATKIIMIEK